jgi:hypothetical protein
MTSFVSDISALMPAAAAGGKPGLGLAGKGPLGVGWGWSVGWWGGGFLLLGLHGVHRLGHLQGGHHPQQRRVPPKWPDRGPLVHVLARLGQGCGPQGPGCGKAAGEGIALRRVELPEPVPGTLQKALRAGSFRHPQPTRPGTTWLGCVHAGKPLGCPGVADTGAPTPQASLGSPQAGAGPLAQATRPSAALGDSAGAQVVLPASLCPAPAGATHGRPSPAPAASG